MTPEVIKLTAEELFTFSTGILAVRFGDFHEKLEKVVGFPVWTHEMPILLPTYIMPFFKNLFPKYEDTDWEKQMIVERYGASCEVDVAPLRHLLKFGPEES